MQQFNLKAAIVSVAFVCIGLACVKIAYGMTIAKTSTGNNVWIFLSSTLTAGASFGAALGALLNHKLKWAMIGIGILMLVGMIGQTLAFF